MNQRPTPSSATPSTTPSSEAPKPEVDWILGFREVIAITGFSRASIYRLVKINLFPVPAKVGSRKVGWKTSQINAWLEQRFDSSSEKGKNHETES